MASAPSAEDKNAERRKRVLLGQLPSDFLRLNTPEQKNAAHNDPNKHAVRAVQQHLQFMSGASGIAASPIGSLSVTVVQARLVKNYGILQMDPYVRLRVGHFIYETNTDNSGGKTPRWNKVVQCLLPKGVNTINLEIFDECSFTDNELIAWANIPIPPEVMNQETKEGWYDLSGKQGNGLEGMINLVLSFTELPIGPGYQMMNPFFMVPSQNHYQPVYTQPAPAIMLTPPQLSEEELKQIQEMFPNLELEIIKSVAEANHSNKCATVNALLQITE